MSWITNAAAGTGAAVGLGYYLKLSNTAKKLQAIPTAQIHTVGTGGVSVEVSVTIKNPTNTSLDIVFPYVEVYDKDSNKLVGSSQVINKTISIPSYGEATVGDIIVSFPISNVLSIAASFFTGSKKPINLLVRTTTTVLLLLGFVKLPIVQETPITLNGN